MRMDAGVRNLFLYEAFLYYNPLLLIVRFHVLYIEQIFHAVFLSMSFSLSLYFWFTGLDGLALGSESLGFFPLVSQLFKNI